MLFGPLGPSVQVISISLSWPFCLFFCYLVAAFIQVLLKTEFRLALHIGFASRAVSLGLGRWEGS